MTLAMNKRRVIMTKGRVVSCYTTSLTSPINQISSRLCERYSRSCSVSNLEQKKMKQSREEALAVLRSGGWCYAVALFQHCDISQESFDKEAFNYISTQADFVRNHSGEVYEFLLANGAEQVSEKHLQYFFAIEPPCYRPYMLLWEYCFQRMTALEMLPADADRTLVRLLNDGRPKRFLNLK